MAAIFCPGSMTVTVSGSHPETSLPEASAWDALGSSYALIGTASHQPPLVGTTLFLSFDRVADLPPPLLTPEAAAAEQLAEAHPAISPATTTPIPTPHAAAGTHAQPPSPSPADQLAQGTMLQHPIKPEQARPPQEQTTFVLGSFEAAEQLTDSSPSSATTTPRSSLSPSRPASPFPGLLRADQAVHPALAAGQPADGSKVLQGPACSKDVVAKHQVTVSLASSALCWVQG